MHYETSIGGYFSECGASGGDTDYCGTCAPQRLPSMALNAAFRECGLRLGIDCLRFCFPPRAVNHRSAVVGARKVPREAEVIIPGCMCPSTHPMVNRTRRDEAWYQAIGGQIGFQSGSSSGRPIMELCSNSAQVNAQERQTKHSFQGGFR